MLLPLLLGLAAPLRAAPLTPGAPAAAETAGDEGPDEAGRAYPLEDRLEFSFGRSLLIVEQALYGQPGERAMPVSSSLFIGELLVRPSWSGALVANVPLTPIQRFDGDEYDQEHSASTVAVGAAWSPVQPQLSPTSIFKPQLGLFGGRTIRRVGGDTFFPMIVARLSLCADSGFTMYAGAAWAFETETLAAIYGVGHRF